MGRTLEQRPSNTEGFPKAGELIEIRGTGSLTLQDRRTLNLLYAHAGDRIAEDRHHRISLQALRGSHVGNERVKDSVDRLIKTVVQIPISDRRGKPAWRMFPLLADTTICQDEDDPSAELVYLFSPGVREIIGQSDQWGRIRSQLLFQLSSKYALALYEMLCLRRNRQKRSDRFEVADLRALLGVKKGDYERMPDFLRRVLEPAVLEVAGLSDLKVTVVPVREGGPKRGKVTGFLLEWDHKTADEMAAAAAELNRPRVGRRARLRDQVEELAAE
jgi:plasmid replication initiation protein